MKLSTIFVYLVLLSTVSAAEVDDDDADDDHHSISTTSSEEPPDDDDYGTYDDQTVDNNTGTDMSSPLSLQPIQTLLNTLWSRQLNRTDDTRELFLRFHWTVGQTIEAVIRTLLPVLMEDLYQMSLPEDCLRTLYRMVDAVRTQKQWPFDFIDSSARFPFAGLFTGTNADYGDYDQCLDIDYREDDMQVTGQYCMSRIWIPMTTSEKQLRFYGQPVINITGTPLDGTFWEQIVSTAKYFYIARGLNLGLCTPRTCSRHVLKSLLEKYIAPTGLGFTIDRCETRSSITSVQLSTVQIISITIYGILLLVCLAASLADTLSLSRNPLFIAFSVQRNMRALFARSTHTPRLATVHGLRVVAIFWILCGHVYLMQFFRVFPVIRRPLADLPRAAWLRYQPLKVGAFLQVDTFFCLGGMTAAFVTLEMTVRVARRFDYFAFLVFRWLRYTPAVLGLVLLYPLLPLLGSGPIFTSAITGLSQPCELYFWRNLLYFNNFYGTDGNCATHTWYLAADFQLYAVLTPILLYVLQRQQAVGLALAAVLVVMSCGISIVPPLMDNTILPTMYSLNNILSEEAIDRHFLNLYWPAVQHISPYTLGLVVGYLVHRHHRKVQISSPIRLLVWTLTTSTAVASIFWSTTWMDSTAASEPAGYVERLLFTATHRLMWSVLPAWIVLVSAFGKPGWLGRVLASPSWVPLSRLTYCIYLCHLVPIVLRAYTIRQTTAFSDMDNWSAIALCSILSILLALVLHVMFEKPFAEWLNLLRKSSVGESK
ncbi:nose resistant to fluoxetine protein 6-like [Oppia nitens]|uniref:nose resistant to fluoxetine protein 6-like n=1 Tax=Oppia nitens TaxID=1686743 RepID=UPI0023DCCE31|nr:nose resistant to fluoxetine protein 6-like [Oppia nitens]